MKYINSLRVIIKKFKVIIALKNINVKNENNVNLFSFNRHKF